MEQDFGVIVSVVKALNDQMNEVLIRLATIEELLKGQQNEPRNPDPDCG